MNFESIMPGEGSQSMSPLIVRFLSGEMSTILAGKSVETEKLISGCQRLGRKGNWGVTADRCRLSLWDDGNVLASDNNDLQIYETPLNCACKSGEFYGMGVISQTQTSKQHRKRPAIWIFVRNHLMFFIVT